MGSRSPAWNNIFSRCVLGAVHKCDFHRDGWIFRKIFFYNNTRLFYIYQTAGCFKSKGERCRGGQVSSTADIDSTPSPDAGGVVGCQHQLSGSISQAVVIHKTATPDRGQKHFRQAAAVTTEKQPNSHETYVLQVWILSHCWMTLYVLPNMHKPNQSYPSVLHLTETMLG